MKPGKLVDLKERIALAETFSPVERSLLLDLVNATATGPALSVLAAMEKPVEEYKARFGDVEWTCGHVACSMCAECYRALAWRAHELAEENVVARSTFEAIRRWCAAYPRTVFPEPDFAKAADVLRANGMTLDAISAYAMREVLERVKIMIDAADVEIMESKSNEVDNDSGTPRA